MTFSSSATNLVPGVPAGTDIYVRDLVANTTIWASSYARTALYSLPNASNAVCFSHRISADGRFIAYETSPTQVSAQNWPTNCIVLRYDAQTGLTDVITNGAILAGPPEDIKTLALTPDGRFIAYTANPNSRPGLAAAIYLWDSFSNTSALVSADLAGAVSTNALSLWPSITPDGRFVAFQSAATNLVTNSLAGEFHLYLRDMRAQVTTLVDVDTNGVGSGVTPLTMPGLSDNAQFVTFEAADGTLIEGPSNPSADVFVRDLLTASTELISNHDPSLRSRTPNGPSILSPLSVSAEGSFVVFASDASDLVPNDTNGYRDVFVRDLLANITLLVTVDLSEAASGNGASTEPVISGDGRYVAFTSTATNLVVVDNNRASDVFVRDLLTGTTELVSVNTNGLTGNHASYAPTITADGRAVLFHSLASDLVPGPFGSSIENIFWRDLPSATTYALTSFNLPYPISLLPAALTPDGRFVVFGSQQTNWYIWDAQLHTTIYTNVVPSGNRMNIVAVSPDANRIAFGSGTTLYLVDRAAGTTNVLGALRSNLMGGGFAHVDPHFSADGRYLAYITTSGNVPADTNGIYDVYLYDCQTFSNTLVSQSYDALASGDGDSDSPDISPDGRFVVYRSAASNLVPGDANGAPDIFLWDRLSSATMLLSVSHSSNSTADNRSLTPVFSSDGSTILFESWASDIMPPDFNRGSDLFAANLLSSGPIPLFRVAIVLGSGAGVWLAWPAVFGKSYTVQFKNSLADPVWQELPGPIAFVGAKAYLNDLAPAAGQRFYRVVAE